MSSQKYLNISHRQRVLFATLFVLAIIFGILFFLPLQLDLVYLQNYVLDGLGLIIVVLVLFCAYCKNRLDLFEPLIICSFIYAALFFFMPMYDILIGEIHWFGFDFFPYGIYGTLFAIMGYVAFALFYFKGASKPKKKFKKFCSNRYTSSAILALYCVSFIANLFYLTRTSGNSILYILTFGMFGQSGGSTLDVQIGFIGMLSNCLPSATLLYCSYGKSRTIKIVTIVLMIMVQMSNGFRFIVVETAFFLTSYYFLIRGKRPKLIQIIAMAIVAMIPIFLMTLFRESVRQGLGVDLSTVNLNELGDVFDEAIFDNLRIYKNYYGLIGVVPGKFPFQFLDMIVIMTIKMIIPSAIWPNKYDGFISPGIESYYGGPFLGTGQAYPNLGEFYLSFGLIGILFFMSLFGFWMGSLKARRFYSCDPTDLIIYSVTAGNALQIIIRGYTPSNFYLVVFSVLPVLIIRFFGSWETLGKRSDGGKER